MNNNLILFSWLKFWVVSYLCEFPQFGFCEFRAYDRAAIKFRGVDADINFSISDYEEDMKQVGYSQFDLVKQLLLWFLIVTELVCRWRTWIKRNSCTYFVVKAMDSHEGAQNIEVWPFINVEDGKLEWGNSLGRSKNPSNWSYILDDYLVTCST